MIERHDHAGRCHALDEITARNDDVEAGVAGAQLCEQLVVGCKQAGVDVDACRLLEISQCRLADVGIPIVKIEFGFFGLGSIGRKAFAGKCQSDGRRAEPFQDRPPCPALAHRFAEFMCHA